MNFLDKEYTKYDTANESWRNGLFLATVVLGIFLLFQPFGFRDKAFELKLILFPLYSLLAYFFSITNFFVVRHILKTKKKWTVKNELLSFISGMLPFTFLVLLLTCWITGDMPLSLYWYFKLLYHVSSLFLIIAIIEFLYYSKKSSVIRSEDLFSQIQLVSRQLEGVKREPDLDIVSISLENGSIDINIDKIIFIKSVGNYLEFYFRESDGQIKKLEKRGRIHQAEKDLGAKQEFLRCHRAFIVNLKQAKQMKGNSKNARLVFDPKLEEIPVTRTQFKNLKKQLDKIIAG